MNDNTTPEWGFYGRTVEQAEIEKILSSGRWFFCSISGRRRIGKTTLIRRALSARSDLTAFYFQVPDSDERGVVQAFQDAVEDTGTPLSDVKKLFHNFNDIAAAITLMCELGWIVVIDEFQYFHRSTLAPFTSYLQLEVDHLRNTNKGGLFVLGSIHTEMTAILEDKGSPLFNRTTNNISVGHWDFSTIFEMFSSHGINDPAHQLFLWSLFEGVPKFYRDCFEEGVLTSADEYRQRTLRRIFFAGSSPLRDEAANWFLRELRGRYDSVLKLLANAGPSSYGELVQEYGRAGSAGEKQLSAYLQVLIERYQMVEKRIPIFATSKSRKGRYVITDNFLVSWLGALARSVQMARIRPIDQAVEKADVALQSLEGFGCEKMVRLLTEECSRKGVGDFSLTALIQGYWNKPDGSDIEIDLVAYNEDEKIVRFGSCKRNAARHDDRALRNFDTHVERFLRQTKEGKRFSNWRVEKMLYCPSFPTDKREALVARGYGCLDLREFAGFLDKPDLPLFESNMDV